MLKFIDLFAGTGGFSEAFSKDFTCVYANDIEESSEKIYKLNFPNHNFELKDINLINEKIIPNHDILCAGFSCQPFSIAGERKGFDDERSNVFWKILKIMDYHRPRFAILENVKNLENHNHGETFNLIKNEIKKLNFLIKYTILDTAKVTDIPQHRERIYIVCFREEKDYNNFNFNINTINENKKIKNFLEISIDKKYYYNNNLKCFQTIKDNIKNHINDNIVYQYRRYYVRENKNNLVPTLTANMGGGGHNVPLLLDDNGIRKLTPRECFNLQGFSRSYKLPEDLCDSKLYKLAGNAISVPVVEIIKNQILKIL